MTTTTTYNQLAAVNAMLSTPATAMEAADAYYRVNTDIGAYFTRPPVNRTPLMRLDYGTRRSIENMTATMENAPTPMAPTQALAVATAVAIMRRDAERLIPASAIPQTARKRIQQAMPA